MFFEKQSSHGYELYKPFIDVDQWVIDFKNGEAFHGSSREIAIYMIKKLEFDTNELDFALDEMNKNSHNAASFGIFKTFIYSFNKEIKNYNDKAS